MSETYQNYQDQLNNSSTAMTINNNVQTNQHTQAQDTPRMSDKLIAGSAIILSTVSF